MTRNTGVSTPIYRKKTSLSLGNVPGNLNVKGILNEIKIFSKGHEIAKYRRRLYVPHRYANNLLLDISFDIIPQNNKEQWFEKLWLYVS